MKFIHEEYRIYLEDEKSNVVAEVNFPEDENDKNVRKITRTFVDESLRGQGIANLLLEELAKDLRKNNLKCIPICSYAVNWFEKHEDQKDLLK